MWWMESREPATSKFQTQERLEPIRTTSSDQTDSCHQPFPWSIQQQCREKRRAENDFKFKWCLSSRVQRVFFTLPLQPPPPERGNKSRVFALSRSHGGAGGQTGITDENMRLSGAPLKEDCWGGPETSMSCLWARVCVHWRTERRRRKRRRQVLLHYRWWDGVSISRSKCWYISDRPSTNTHRRANGHTIYAPVQDNCSDLLFVLLLFNHLSFVSLCSTFVTACHDRSMWECSSVLSKRVSIPVGSAEWQIKIKGSS